MYSSCHGVMVLLIGHLVQTLAPKLEPSKRGQERGFNVDAKDDSLHSVCPCRVNHLQVDSMLGDVFVWPLLDNSNINN